MITHLIINNLAIVLMHCIEMYNHHDGLIIPLFYKINERVSEIIDRAIKNGFYGKFVTNKNKTSLIYQ